jgi:hypothetical protein
MPNPINKSLSQTARAFITTDAANGSLRVLYAVPRRTLIEGFYVSIFPTDTPLTATASRAVAAFAAYTGITPGSGILNVRTTDDSIRGKDVFAFGHIYAQGVGAKFVQCRKIIEAGDGFVAELSVGLDDVNTNLVPIEGIITPIGRNVIEADDVYSTQGFRAL